MPQSYIRLPGNGSNTNFNFSFGYLSRSHIHVFVDDKVTAFKWLTDFSIQITPAPANGSVVEIRRITPTNQQPVLWTDGSTITERDMNLEARFNLYVHQEARDATVESNRIVLDTAAALTAAFGAMGFLPPVKYTAGLTIKTAAQTVSYNGEVYAPIMDKLPFTTSGTFETDKFYLVSGVKASDLASPNPALGATMVGRNVVSVDSIPDLLALPEVARREDLRYSVRGFYPGSNVGGGEFYWDASSTETEHAGVILKIPGVPTGRMKRVLNDTVDVLSFGAIGDGTLHTVAEWITPGARAWATSLEEVQERYPHVKSTSDSIDWAACQAAASLGKHVYAPSGHYVFTSDNQLIFPHTGSYYRLDTGVKFFGDGIDTLFSRGEVWTPSNFVDTAVGGLVVDPGKGVTSRRGEPFINNTGAAITLTSGNEDDLLADGLVQDYQGYVDEAAIVFFGSYYVPEDFRVENSRCGIYLGQDPSETSEGSHLSFNRFSRVVVRNCSVGLRWRASGGAYYNSIRDVHISQCQIGFDFGNMRSLSTHNWNRNKLDNIRASRCNVGIWLRYGDTNTLIACHTEGCGPSPSGVNFASTPRGLPRGEQSWSVINQGTKNRFLACVDEGNSRKLYSSDSDGEYIDTLYGEYNNLSEEVYFENRPRIVLNQRTTWLQGGRISALSNTAPNAFGTRPTGVTVPGGIRTGTEIRFADNHAESNGGGSAPYLISGIDNIVDLGELNSGGSVSHTLWQNSTSNETRGTNASAFFEVDVLGDGGGSNLVHHTKFRVLAKRNNSRTVIRYGILDVVGGYSSGAGSASTGEAFTPSLSVDGSNNLILTIEPPSERSFSRVMLSIRSRYVRP